MQLFPKTAIMQIHGLIYFAQLLWSFQPSYGTVKGSNDWKVCYAVCNENCVFKLKLELGFATSKACCYLAKCNGYLVPN